MSDRIDHAAEARDLLYRARPGSSWQGPVAVAQVHATLALVEQQRIANVIAYGQAIGNDARSEAQHEAYESGGGTDGYLSNDERAAIGVEYS